MGSLLFGGRDRRLPAAHSSAGCGGRIKGARKHGTRGQAAGVSRTPATPRTTAPVTSPFTGPFTGPGYEPSTGAVPSFAAAAGSTSSA